jgi:hypothetical protein
MQAKFYALKDFVPEEMKCEMEKQGFGSTDAAPRKLRIQLMVPAGLLKGSL